MIALYARVSTKEQTNENQIGGLVEWAERNGKRYRLYEEKASGKNVERIELERMMSKADDGKWEAVVVWKIDRFSRSVRDFVQLFERLNRAGVGFVSVSQGIDTRNKNDPAVKMLISLLMVFAEFERDMIVSRTKEGMARAKREGKKIGRPKVSFMLTDAVAYWMQGNSIAKTAKKFGVSKSVMGVRLKEWKESVKDDE